MLTAKDIMTREVLVVAPETPVNEFAALLAKNRISGAPVVDADGTLVGVATENDLIDQKKRLHIPTVAAILDAVILLENPFKLDKEFKKMTGTTVADIATSDPITVGEETPVEEIATIMAEKGAHTLPVLTDDGRLVGVVGKTDIIRTISAKG